MKLALASDGHDGMMLMPLVQHLVTASDEQLKCARSEHNFAVASGGHKKDVVAPAFNARRLFRENTSVVHSLVSSLRYAEQVKQTALSKVNCKPLTGLNSRPVSGRLS